MARILQLHTYDGPSGLSLDDVQITDPGSGQVRIQVHAFALNWGDMDLMRDEYSFSFEQLPARIGSECVGTVDAVGAGVDSAWIGKRVCTVPHFYGNNGVNGEFAIVPAHFITAAPVGLSDAEACSIWMQYLTAYFPLVEIGHLGTDSSILIIAATGSAGLGALQLARCLGVRSICTTRFDRNRRYLEEAGADFVIATATQDLSLRLQEIGGSVDLVYDPVGGKIIDAYADALAQDAKIVIYGGISGEPTILPELQLTKTNSTVHLYSVMNYMENHEYRDRGISFIRDQLDREQLKPVVDRSFPLSDFSEAFAYMSNTRQQHGKVVIQIDQTNK